MFFAMLTLKGLCCFLTKPMPFSTILGAILHRETLVSIIKGAPRCATNNR
jgi:hypothetical protein